MTYDEKCRARGEWDRVRIPAARSGNMEIIHVEEPAGAKVMLSNPRNAMFGQKQDQSVTFDEPTTWHKLIEHDGDDAGVWMSDIPAEQHQHKEALSRVHGNVLVGGLGLGLTAGILTELYEDDTYLVIVEKNADVIALVEPWLPDNCEVVHADLMEWIKTPAAHEWIFDSAFFDIWQSDGEGTFFSTVVPLRQACLRLNIEDEDVHCWNEDVMRGQLSMGLHSRRQFMGFDDERSRQMKETLLTAQSGPSSIWTNWSLPYFRMVEDGSWSEEEATTAAQLYAGAYGRPRWLVSFRAALESYGLAVSAS